MVYYAFRRHTVPIRTPYYYTHHGFLVILSGSPSDAREHAGVGFIIASSCRNHIIGFCAASNRMTCLRMKCSKGKFAIFSAYAPTGIYPYDVRQEYFANLATFYESVSVRGPKYILGDLNSRIFERQAEEEHIIGH